MSPTRQASDRGRAAALRAAVATVRDENVTLLAAGVAYYAFVSLVPLLLLALGVASLVGGEALAERVVAATDESLTSEGQELLRGTLTAGAAAGGATVAGLAVLTWSGLRLFRGLDRAFSQVYGTTEGGGLLSEVRDGLVVLVAVGLGVTAVAVAGGAVSRLAGGSALVVRGLSVLTLVVAFLPLYYVFPGQSMSVRSALPGTVVAAVGWSVLGSAFGAYAAVAGGSVYGMLGAALLLATWLYLGALIVMVGAVVNATLAGVTVDAPSGSEPAATADRQVQQARPSHDSPMTDDEPSADSPPSPGDEDGESDDGDSDGSGSPTDGTDGTGPDTVGPGGAGADGDHDALDVETDAETAEELAALRTDLARLREQFDDLETRVDDRTVSRDDLEADLRRYVRARQRRGHARGWGPYLVLLYGTAMTLGAFVYLRGAWAVTAMLVVWLSTLGLYALMVLVGVGLSGVSAAGRLRDLAGRLRR